MKLKRIGFAALLVVFVLGAAFHYSSAEARSDHEPIAAVNGIRITGKEFGIALQGHRASVMDYFRQAYGAAYGENFWQTSYNGEIPEETLKQRALEEIVRSKLQLELAVQYGWIQGASYNDLIQEMEKENKRRKAAVHAGQPIYGPVEFQESTFMGYFLSKLRLRLIERLSEEQLAVSREELERHYELVKDRLFRLEDRIQFHRISISYLQDGKSDLTYRSSVKAILGGIKQGLAQGLEVEEVVLEKQTEYESYDIRVTEEVLTPETARIFYKSQPELYAILTDLGGLQGTSPVFDERSLGDYVVIRVADRTEAGYKSFEESEDAVRMDYLNAAYEAFIDRLVLAAEVEIQESNYARFG